MDIDDYTWVTDVTCGSGNKNITSDRKHMKMVSKCGNELETNSKHDPVEGILNKRNYKWSKSDETEYSEENQRMQLKIETANETPNTFSNLKKRQ